MLSNTAVPKYYGRFREKVLRGEIAVCETVSLEMNRIDKLIADPRYYYNENAVEGWIKFCESELTLTDGRDFHMTEAFKIWGEQLYGWYYFVERSVYQPGKDGQAGGFVQRRIPRRLINKQYVILGRGGAKTMYDSSIQAFELNVDKSTTQQVTVAPTMKQADEVLLPIKTAITRSKGPLFKFLTEGSINNTTGSAANRVKLASTKNGIVNYITGSILEVRPMSVDKTQGLRNKVSTVDEWLSGDIREDVIVSLEQGASKIPNWIIVATSSEGTVRNGVGDTIKMELMDILRGKYNNPHVSIWWYRLDDVKEVAYPELWVKANPNLGITVSYETYQIDVERAQNVPSARNDILAKRFGIPMEGYTYYFTFEETQPHPKREFWQLPCSMGVDLSRGDDFCAFCFLFPLRNGCFGVKCRAYISALTFRKLLPATRDKYQDFINEGSLCVMEGSVLNMMDVYDDVERFRIEHQYDVRSMGYDPYNAREFVERYCRENGDYSVIKVIQGAKTESVPLGELKSLAGERMLIFDESIMSFCMGNSVAQVDTNGNKKLMKNRYDEKIDLVAAMMDAYIAWKARSDLFE